MRRRKKVTRDKVTKLSKPCVRKEIHKFKGEHLLSAFFNLKQLIGCLI